MHIEIAPTLINQLRETMEGASGPTWIVDHRADAGVFGVIDSLGAEQALRPIAPGHRSIAEHVKHLQFSLALTHQRMQGQDPKASGGAVSICPMLQPTGGNNSNATCASRTKTCWAW
jgi:hypothetical protein